MSHWRYRRAYVRQEFSDEFSERVTYMFEAYDAGEVFASEERGGYLSASGAAEAHPAWEWHRPTTLESVDQTVELIGTPLPC